MTIDQQSGTGANEKNQILSEKSQTSTNQSADNLGVQAADASKVIPSRERPGKPDSDRKPEINTKTEKRTDRPGFDLGGASGENSAGKGLGFGTDAMDGREDWRLRK